MMGYNDYYVVKTDMLRNEVVFGVPETFSFLSVFTFLTKKRFELTGDAINNGTLLVFKKSKIFMNFPQSTKNSFVFWGSQKFSIFVDSS